MKALKITGIVIGALIVLVLLLGAIAPNEMKTAKSITIDAPVEQVFNTVNDLKTWESWSPWKEMDPGMQVTMGEKSVGEGAYYTWTGDESGSGKMTILESEPSSRLLVDVEFDGMGGAKAPWTFAGSPEGTYVTWGFDSKMPYPMNAMLLFMDMTEAIGNDFERGLNKLKTKIESEKRSATPKQTIIEGDMPYSYMVGIRGTVKMSEIQQFYKDNLGKVYNELSAKKISMAGQPCGVYFSWDEQNQTAEMMAAIPVAKEVDLGGEFETVALPDGQAIILNFYGNYDQMDRAHNIIDNYVLLKKLETEMPVIEEYVTDPTNEPDPSRWLTKVIYPIKS
ncbi:SRPBCC family protein [Flavilitoribacter nigricans]|nr:SRPBCC family protein [Flavilitoribacter nigricans]